MKSIILSCVVLTSLSYHHNNNIRKSYCQSKPITKMEIASSSSSSTISNIIKIEDLRPPKDLYERVDTLLLTDEYRNFTKNHAIHDSLHGDKKIEVYEIYKKKDADELKCIIRFGEALNGHKGIVHGGISSAIIDNTFGWLFMSCKLPSAFTANLNINFKSPIYANTVVILNAKLLKVEGRKMYMNCSMEDIEGKELVNATTLFITMQK